MRLSAAQLRMLRSVRDHGSTITHLHGRSSHGGADRTRNSLRRLALIEATQDMGWQLTAAGKEAIK